MTEATGRVALVTGASRGIGAATARLLTVRGRQVLGAPADALALDLQISGARAERLLDWAPHAPSILDDLVHGSYHAETPSRGIAT